MTKADDGCVRRLNSQRVCTELSRHCFIQECVIQACLFAPSWSERVWQHRLPTNYSSDWLTTRENYSGIPIRCWQEHRNWLIRWRCEDEWTRSIQSFKSESVQRAGWLSWLLLIVDQVHDQSSHIIVCDRDDFSFCCCKCDLSFAAALNLARWYGVWIYGEARSTGQSHSVRKSARENNKSLAFCHTDCIMSAGMMEMCWGMKTKTLKAYLVTTMRNVIEWSAKLPVSSKIQS